jgi:hypothetical protein
MQKRNKLILTSRWRAGFGPLFSIPVLVALAASSTFAAGGGEPSGYAALVRRAAPSVVTVLVEELSVGAGKRAADRANAATGNDGVEGIIRRLLSGANSAPGNGEKPTTALGSGLSFVRTDSSLRIATS